jgi:hypothetical protein
MKLVWSPEELVEHWSIEPEDRANIPDTVGEFGCLGLPRSGQPSRPVRAYRGEDTIRNFQHVKDRGEAGPIGYPDRYSIEQTPSDKNHILLKDGSDPKAAGHVRPACPWGGSTSSVFEWRLPLENAAGARPSSVSAALEPRATRSSRRLAC